MRRAIATAAALGAVIAPAAVGPAAGAGCTATVAWHATRYKPVATHARLPLGRRLGTGMMLSCSTTNPPPGYGIPAAGVRRAVFAVDGLRPRVAVALRGAKPTLWVSRTRATPAELRVLARLRGR
jgi:hypothetical protein